MIFIVIGKQLDVLIQGHLIRSDSMHYKLHWLYFVNNYIFDYYDKINS